MLDKILIGPYKSNWYYFPKFSAGIFLLLFISASFYYNYQSIIFKSPQSIHQWRQSDCISITYNYYKYNSAFLEPEMHNLGPSGNSKVMSECPIIYYAVAQLWKLFGHHEFIYRLFVLSLFFISLFLLFRFLERRLNDSILAIIGALVLFSSPTLVYYANNYLMDIPALSMAIIGLYFFYKYVNSRSIRHFLWFALFSALAGLFKASSMLFFCVVVCIFILESIGVRLLKEGKLFKRPLLILISIICVLAIQLIWYNYASDYNSKHYNNYFLIGILPIWGVEWSSFSRTFEAMEVWSYFRNDTLKILLALLLFLLFSYKRISRLNYLITIISTTGVLGYMILFFGALEYHDYYMINTFIIIPIYLITLFDLIQSNYAKFFHSFLFRILVIAFLIHNVDYSRIRITGRYNPNGWENVNYINKIKLFQSIQPYLKSLGIKEEDRVISLSDFSGNITLYLMDRKGWTNYDINSKSERIADRIEMGAKYLITYDDNLKSDSKFKRYFRNKIGQFEHIEIYKLTN